MENKAQPIRTLKEVIEEAHRVMKDEELYKLDTEIITKFRLEDVMGDVEQMCIVLQALRTFALLAATENQVRKETIKAEDEREEPIAKA